MNHIIISKSVLQRKVTKVACKKHKCLADKNTLTIHGTQRGPQNEIAKESGV